MSARVDTPSASAPPDVEAPRFARTAWLLLLAAVALLAAAGLVLWWRHGEAVFAQYLLAAVAWCF